mmetsp:Transcript_4786/g.11761  ORF Transcript_4786/g.11761 Transcript_4786/m.11761 type:complete len:1692 (+) Transcript_4786:326-5401(+)
MSAKIGGGGGGGPTASSSSSSRTANLTHNRVEKLVLHNWKSYENTVTVGPFDRDFTCVIGPNGSGKSNIVDAFGFVLGIQAKELRGNKLNDLIHRKPSEPADVNANGMPGVHGGRDAYVELVFFGQVAGILTTGLGGSSSSSSQKQNSSRRNNFLYYEGMSSSESSGGSDDSESESSDDEGESVSDHDSTGGGAAGAEPPPGGAGHHVLQEGLLRKSTQKSLLKNVMRKKKTLQLDDAGLGDEVFGGREKNKTRTSKEPSKAAVKSAAKKDQQRSVRKKDGKRRSGAEVVEDEDHQLLTGRSSKNKKKSRSRKAERLERHQLQAAIASQPPRRVVFQRFISGKTGEGQYKVDGKITSMDEYLRILSSIRILTRARNFLVFQGDVESLSARQGMELTKFFERICGSDCYKEECDRLNAQKREAEDKLRVLFGKKRHAVVERKQVELQRAEAEKYRQLVEERNLLQTEFYLFRLNTIEQQLDAERQKAEELTNARQLAEQSFQKELKDTKKEEEIANKMQMEIGKLTNGLALGLGGKNSVGEFLSGRGEGSSSLVSLNPEYAKLRKQRQVIFAKMNAKKELMSQSDAKKVSLEAQIAERRKDAEQLQQGLRKVQKEIADCVLPFESEEIPVEGTSNESADDAMEVDWDEQAGVQLPQEKKLTEKGREQQRRYREAVKESESAVPTKMIDEQRELDYQQREQQSTLGRKVQDVCELERKIANCKNVEKEHANSLEALENELATLNGGVEAKKKAVAELKHKLEVVWGEDKKKLEKEKHLILDGVQSGTISQRQLEREQRLSQSVKEMTSQIPGVYGRICELCKPTQKQFRVPLNVALGSFLDAVLCDSAATCRKCVMWLKQRHLEPMTFIPLRREDIRGSLNVLEERVVNGLKASCTTSGAPAAGNPLLASALSILTFDRKTFGNAFNYLLGFTIVVDNLATARKVAYQELPKLLGRSSGCRIVTLDGEMIKPNGNMTVNSDAANEGGTKFDITEMQKAGAQLETIDKRMLGIVNLELNANRERVALENELGKLVSKGGELGVKVGRVREDLRRKKKEREDGLEPALASAERERSQKQNQLQITEEAQIRIEADVNRIVGSFFTELSAELDLPDIRAVDLQQKRDREKLRMEETKLQTQVDNYAQQLDLLQGSLKKYVLSAGEMEQGKEEMKKLAEEGEKLELELKKMEKQEQEDAQKIESRKKRLAELKIERGAKDKILGEMKKKVVEKKKVFADCGKKLDGCRGKVESLQGWRSDLWRHALMESITIPVVMDENLQKALADGKISESDATKKKRKSSAQRGSSAATSSSKNPLPDDPTTTKTSNSNLLLEKLILETGGKELAIDYSSLPDDRKNHDDLNVIKEQTREYETEIEKVKAEMEDLRPNLKAAERMDAVQKDLMAKTKEAEQARKLSAKIDEKIARLREKRKKRFLDCFQFVSGAIQDVYAELTATVWEEERMKNGGFTEEQNKDNAVINDNPLGPSRHLDAGEAGESIHLRRIDEGGRAFLDLDNPSVPFEGGIRYTTMAPSKRFRDMSLLSGGEKTLAALALLFAIHAYQKPPFLILDEVDAALDAYNVQAVRRYCAKMQTGASDHKTTLAGCQIIVISLKDRFFSRAEALVGVYKDKHVDASNVLTLDLRKYNRVVGGGRAGGSKKTDSAAVGANTSRLGEGRVDTSRLSLLPEDAADKMEVE